MSDRSEFDSAGSEMPAALPSGFRAAVTSALSGMGYSVVGWEPDGVNVISTERDGEQFIGISNLHRRAKSTDRADWPGMIREFLGHVTGSISSTRIPDDLVKVANRLRPRLGRPFSREGKTYPWGISLPGTDLEINLVVDYPHTMAYVTEEMLEKTGRSGEDLLDLALANLRKSTGGDFLDRVSDELDILVGHSGDGYDAARALLLEEILPPSPAGHWVAIPSREELVAWPVSFNALCRIHVMKLFAQDTFRDHAYPITDEVYWIWQGNWYPFGITIDDQNVTVSPPEEFMAALKELEGDEGDDGPAS